MKIKRTCPNCGNKSMILESSINDNNFLRTPLVCKVCGYIDLIIEEDNDIEISDKPRNSVRKTLLSPPNPKINYQRLK